MLQLDDVIKLVSRQLGIKKVQADDSLREDLGAESLDIQNLLTQIEEKTGARLDDDAVAEIETVADLHRAATAAA